MMKNPQRITLLREHALLARPSMRSQEGELHYDQAWVDSAGEPFILRRALSRAAVLAQATPVVDDGELIVGKPCYRTLDEGEMTHLAQLRLHPSIEHIGVEGQASHMAVDYEKLLHLGVEGILAEVQAYETACLDEKRRTFYQACRITLEALADYARRYSEYTLELAGRCEEPSRKEELEDIAAALRHVPLHPARSFREAVQSVHFLTFCMEGLYQWGRPDRYLLPYYERDMAQGVLTKEDAQEIIDCHCILFTEYIPPSLAVGLMIGGRDAEGRDTSNALTELYLESIGHTRLSYPGIGLCCHRSMPDDLLRRACQLLMEGNTHPALFGDEVITRGLRSLGLSEQEACAYIHSTCVEITPCKGSAVWVASPYHNLPQMLLDALEEGEYLAFDDLLEALHKRLCQRIDEEAKVQNCLQAERMIHGGDPLVSCFVEDCLARGLDIDEGGARHNWIMPSFVGMANLADSLYAIKTAVYDEESITLAMLRQALKDNYQGKEALRGQLQRLAKYGNDDDTVDGFVERINGWILEHIRRLRTFRGDAFVPSLFCWIKHEQLGSKTGATPDGRLAGFPLGDGSGPAQGREENGPTASILSSTKWDHAPFIGGIAVNLRFNPDQPGSGVDTLMQLTRVYHARGGFELQVNCVSGETLRKAQETPDLYRDLVVRIGGYSDYFVRLPANMQQEVILRTAH